MTSSIDFKALARELQAQARTLLPVWLPGGKFEGPEYLCADIRGGAGTSLRYNFEKEAGSDFATGDTFGDMINLYSKINNLRMFEAAKELLPVAGMSSDDPATYRQRPAGQLPPLEKPKAVSDIRTPPDWIARPSMIHARHGVPSMIHHYTDAGGNPAFYIARYETPEGKHFSPWSWSESQGWVPKAFPEPRLLYGLYELANEPEKRVLIVEGEKAADAAKHICGKNYVVISWPGGSNAYPKADWSPIYGRKVLIWPDRDFQKNKDKTQILPYEQQPGTKAAVGIAEILYNHCPEIKIINVEQETIAGFDAADAVEAGWTTNDFLNWARQHVKVVKDANTVIESEIVATVDVIDEASLVGQPFYMDDAPMPTEYDEPEETLVKVSKSMGGMLPDRKKNGTPLSTIENMRFLLDQHQIVSRYNVIKKQEELILPGRTFSIDNAQNAALSHVVSIAARFQMPLGQVPEYVSVIADENPYNPITTWITSKPWDGVSRLKDLYNTIKSPNEPLKEILMYRWLISAVAGAFEPDGVVARGVLVFQAPQYLGKTMWFKSLVPAQLEAVADGMLLKPDDKDSVKQIVQYWLVELGELDATFKKSDVAQLKAFISKQRDKLRAAYARKESEYARRTVFFASVNPDQFLADETGNTRYWTVKCEDINHKHGIDMQQLWAEIYEQHYKQGVTWFLTHDEMVMLNAQNEGFVTADPIEEKILSELDWENPMAIWSWKTSTQVIEMLDVKNFGRSEVSKAGLVIRKRNGHSALKFRRQGGVTEHFVPGVRMKTQDFPPWPQ